MEITGSRMKGKKAKLCIHDKIISAVSNTSKTQHSLSIFVFKCAQSYKTLEQFR